jgi:hypothetical protein
VARGGYVIFTLTGADDIDEATDTATPYATIDKAHITSLPSNGTLHEV